MWRTILIAEDDKREQILISSFRRVQNVVCFLSGDSPASDLYMPTFRNTLSVPSFTPAFEDGTDRVFRNVGLYKSDAGESPKRKQTTRTNLFVADNQIET